MANIFLNVNADENSPNRELVDDRCMHTRSNTLLNAASYDLGSIILNIVYSNFKKNVSFIFVDLYLSADLLIRLKHSSRIYWNQWSVPTLFTRGERSSSWKCFNRVCNWIKSCTGSKGQRRRRRGSCSPVQDITSKRTMWIANAPWWPPDD